MITEEEKDKKLFNECASRLKEIGKQNLGQFINTLQEGNTNTLERLFNKYISKVEQLETEKQNAMKDLEKINNSLEKDGFVGYADDIQDILSYMKGEEK